ncbi:MAG TPA: MFS transporter [Actinomycetota bacterium]|jgi:MFS family permease|nr:MFS transporter [Actinomycetota bacterium]
MTAPRTAVRRLALARVISVTGSAAAYTALMFEIYDQTGSSVWLAAALILTEGVTGLVGPLASVLGDRFDRRTVMIVSDLAAAVCFAGMALVASSPGPLVAIAFLSALSEAPFWPASSAAIPNLVPQDEVSWANSLVAIGRNIGIMVGPAIGGILLAAVGAPWVFGINAASFVVSAALVVSVRASFVGDRSDEGEHRGVWAGFRFLFHEPVLRRISVAWVVLVLGIGMAMVADVPLVDVFGAGSAGFGVMIGLWGAGSILGSLAGRWLTAATEMRWLILGTAFTASIGIAIALSPWFALVLVLNVAWGASEGITGVAEQNLFQRRSPDSVRSRVLGAIEGLFHGGLTVSFVAAAIVLPVVGARGMYAIAGVAAGLSAIVLLPLLAEAPVPVGRPTTELP